MSSKQQLTALCVRGVAQNISQSCNSDGLSAHLNHFSPVLFLLPSHSLNHPRSDRLIFLATGKTVVFLGEAFVLSLALPRLAIESRRKELGSLLGRERSKCLSRLLNPWGICDPEISGRLFPFLQWCHPYCVLFSDGFCVHCWFPAVLHSFRGVQHPAYRICRNWGTSSWIWVVVGSKGNLICKGSFNIGACFRTTCIVSSSFFFTVRSAQSESWGFNLFTCLQHSSWWLHVRSGNSTGKKRLCQQTSQTG